MDGLRGYDDWKTTEPIDRYQEDACPDCGEPFDDCQCFPDVEDVPQIDATPSRPYTPYTFTDEEIPF